MISAANRKIKAGKWNFPKKPEVDLPVKLDQDTNSGRKLLRLYQRLLFNAGKHYQGDLADWLKCSRQTVSRLALEIAGVVGTHLQTGVENHRRWYCLVPGPSRCNFGMDIAETRYLRLCRDLAENFEAREVLERMDETMFRFSMLASEAGTGDRERLGKGRFSFFSKGRINYTPFFPIINTLLECRDKQLRCAVDYRGSAGAKAKTHSVVIGDIVCMNNALYMLCGLIDKDGETLAHCLTMAVHRIKSVEASGRGAPFCMLRNGSNTFGLPWHEPKSFRIHFESGSAAEYVRERIWADEQYFEEREDGSLVLGITTRSEPELLAWVRSFGEAARLLPDSGGNEDGNP